MMIRPWKRASLAAAIAGAAVWAPGVPAAALATGAGVPAPVEQTVTVTEGAAGTDLKAQDEAVAEALRKAVKQVCGTFIQAQTQTEDYQAVYDRVFEDTTGYVLEHKVLKVWKDDSGITWAQVRATVSTRRFSEAWSAIAHTISRANNPRLALAIAEATRWERNEPVYQPDPGAVQAKLEEFLLDKGLELVDKETAADMKRRDVLLAEEKGDTAKVAAEAARLHADVIVVGRAWARFGREVELAGQRLYQYSCQLTVRAIRADSAQVLISKTFGPTTVTLTQPRAEPAALTRFAGETAPKLLEELGGAWRKQVHVRRTIPISIAGMDFKLWGAFRAECEKLRGVQALRLREITNDLAQIDVEYRYSNQNLAETLSNLKTVRLEVVEITDSRVKLKVAAHRPGPPSAPASSLPPATAPAALRAGG